jgi:NADH dehydrogenase FAD-containing subunit
MDAHQPPATAARVVPLDSLATTGRPQEIVLLGASLSHLEFLAQLRAKPLTQARVTLVCPDARMLPLDCLTGVISGDTALEDRHIDVESLAQACGVHWQRGKVAQLNLSTQTVTLSDNRALRFDWLSLSPRCWDKRDALGAQMPGALDHGLFSYPLERFLALWPRVLDLHARRTLRITVLGGEGAGAELAFAIKRRLPQAALTWLTLQTAPDPTQDAQTLALQQALQAADITVLHDRALEVAQGFLRLACGATLACDVPVIAEALDAPDWLQASALMQAAPDLSPTAPQELQVDTWSRCTGHPQVFMAAEADPSLGHNLAASVRGASLRAATAPQPGWAMGIGLGPQLAVQWPPLPLRGALTRWAKGWHDHRLHARYQATPAAAPTEDAQP